MNKIERKEINGILNFVAECDDFDSQYRRICKPYLMKTLSGENSYGIFLFTENEKEYIEIPISYRSFLNLNFYAKEKIREIPTSQDLFASISNFYDINFICSFIKKVEFTEKNNDKLFYCYLMLEKDGEILCVNVSLSDIICISKSTSLSLYIKDTILDKIKKPIEELKNRLNPEI